MTLARRVSTTAKERQAAQQELDSANRRQWSQTQQALAEAEAQEDEDRLRLHNHQLALAAPSAKRLRRRVVSLR